MKEVKNNLPNGQAEAVENKEVFTKVSISKDADGASRPKDAQDGVIFIASTVKLMSKDGAHNILSAIGIDNFEGKVDEGSLRSFRPTTFEELLTAFEYTDSRALESYFRMAEENNCNLNALMCSFLENNLETESVDVKALAATSKQVKGIVEQKAQSFYEDKINFFVRKIEKYQSKIEGLKQERSGKDETGRDYSEIEQNFGNVVEGFASSLEQTANGQETQVTVSDVIQYFNSVKQIVDCDNKVGNASTQPTEQDFEQ